MKTSLLIAITAVALQSVDGILDSLNLWVELGIKIAGLAAALGGAWRWVVGPGWRRARAALGWVGAQLELIGRLDQRLDSMDERFDSIDERLERGEAHFQRTDAVLEAFASEEAAAVRRAMHEGQPVGVRPDNTAAVDRRGRNT